MKLSTTKLLGIITFLAMLLSQSAIAQRNANQNSFKLKSQNDYRSRSQNSADNFGSFPQNRVNNNRFFTPGSNEIIFQVNSLMNVKADRFLAVFNLTQIGKTAVETDQLINKRIDGFVDDLKTLSLSQDNIYTDMIYLIPTFEFEVQKKLFSTDTYNEVPKGFEMQKNIHINFTDIRIIDDLVTLAAKNEIYDLVKLDFFVDDTESVYDSLRERSQQFMTRKIQSLENSQELNLSEAFQTIAENTDAIYPETQYSDYDAFVSQSLEAAGSNSGVTKIRKPATVAYDQIPYGGFDIVINPVVLEPVVQFTYTLTVRYELEKKKPETQNKYMLVTPNGDVKELILKQ
ncbi:MAG: SIMPL domain-containing protein [Bacteroidota bacterium]